MKSEEVIIESETLTYKCKNLLVHSTGSIHEIIMDGEPPVFDISAMEIVLIPGESPHITIRIDPKEVMTLREKMEKKRKKQL